MQDNKEYTGIESTSAFLTDLPKMPNLVKALIKASQSIKGIEKTKQVGGTGFGSYKAVEDKEVKLIVRKAFFENGLTIFPIDIDEDTELKTWEENSYDPAGTITNSKRKNSVFTRVKVSYLLAHESGESIVIKGIGHGTDPLDKAAGKATTYALKYTLLYLTLCPTGDIDDTDDQAPDSATLPAQPAAPNATPATTPSAPEEKQLTDKQKESLLKKAKTADELIKAYNSLSKADKNKFMAVKDEMKAKLGIK